jgi:hypothetical protein
VDAAAESWETTADGIRSGSGQGTGKHGPGDEVLGTSDRNESKRHIPRHGLS